MLKSSKEKRVTRFQCINFAMTFSLPASRLALFALVTLPVASDSFSQQEYHNVTSRWITASATFTQLVWPQISLYASLLEEFEQQDYVGTECRASVVAIRRAFQQEPPPHWALKYLDSSGKGRSGMAYGYTSDVGNMDECITNDVTVQDQRISGKYCMLSLNLPLLSKNNVSNLQGVKLSLTDTRLKGSVFELYAVFLEMMMYTPAGFRFGVCLPSACEAQLLERFLNDKLSGSELSVSFLPTCETLDSPIAGHHLVALALCFSYVAFVIYATIVTRESEDQTSWLEHFNFMLNTNKLLVETKDPLAQQISFFHGIRFYYQLAAIVFHSIDIFPFLPTAYAVMYVREWPLWIFKQMYKSIGFFVQIPFAVSGFLTYVTMYPYVRSREGKVGFLDYAFKRWLRSTPTMIGVILFGWAWAAMGRGPVHREAQAMTIEKCKTYWWTNLLYINNWWHFNEMCLFHTWTYSADFQCFLLSYVTISLMIRDKKRGLYSIFFFIAFGCFASGLVTYLKDLSPYPNFEATDARQYDLCTWFYFHTYHTLPAYFIGVLTAYLFLEGKRLQDRWVWPGWLVTFFMTISTGLLPYYVGFDGESTRWLEILHASLHRVFFVAAWVYSAYLCCFNMGGYVQWLYQIKLWVPFGRMSASVFMAHYTFIWFDLGNSMDYVSTRGWNLTMRCTYTVVYSLLYSYAIYLLFEAPAMSLLKSRFRKDTRTVPPSSLDTQLSRRYSAAFKEIQDKISEVDFLFKNKDL